jgi:hypothetical protein
LLSIQEAEATKMTNKQIAVVTGPLPALGQFWEGQGGIRIGEVRGENGQPDYQLILPTDPRAVLRGIWGERGIRVVGADGLRDGYANTVAMAAAGSALAQNILQLEIDGHSDFYLMARHEARLAYLNAPEQFDTAEWYWTSTQDGPYGAWVQDYEDGTQYYHYKLNERQARAVRRVIHSVI